MCRLYEVPQITLEFYLDYFEFPLIDFYNKAGFTFDSYSFEEVSQNYMDAYHSTLQNAVELHEDVLTTLSALSPDYRLGVLSATKQNRLEKVVQTYGLNSYFEVLVGIQDDLAASKLESLKSYLMDLDVAPEEIVIVGDTEHDFEVADACGIDCVLVSKGHQSAKRLQEIGCKVLLNSLGEFPSFLKQ